MANRAFIREIQSAITDEIFFSLGMNRRGFARNILGWVFSWPTRVFARNMAATDESVGKGGPAQGCQTMLDLLGVETSVFGRKNIPTEGPAIILSNHPGVYDSFAIISLLPRKDLKIIASETRFYQVLPHVHPLMLYVNQDPKDRMLVIKDAVDHLRKGGILLQFGSGRMENLGTALTLVTREDMKMVRSIERLVGMNFEKKKVNGFKPSPNTNYPRPVHNHRSAAAKRA